MFYNKGEYYLKTWANEDKVPKFVGPQNEIIDPSKFKAGNLASCIVSLYGGSTPSKYVSASLMAVQWRGEGSPVTAEANLNLFGAVPAQDMPAPAEEKKVAPQKVFG